MSDPRRLLFDPDASEFERELLSSWQPERPDPAAKKRVLAALGIAAVGSAAAAPLATTSIAPKAISTWSSLALVKWSLIATLSAGVVGAIAYGFLRTGSTGEAPAREHVAPTEQTAAPLPRSSATYEAVPSPSAMLVTELPTASAAPPARASAPASAQPPPPPSPSSSLAEQVAELDRARSALEKGDPARAIALVDAYQAKYSDAAFVQEADLVRVESLYAMGDREKADRSARAFLAKYPKSPHAARVRALLGS